MTTSARDALWLLFILIVVGVVWSLSGLGINLPQLGGGPRLAPPKSQEETSGTRPVFGGETAGEGSKKITAVPMETKITIGAQAAQNTDPQKEYITIRNGDSLEINLSNLKLKNKNNEETFIGSDENGKSIILRAGEQALILTGKNTKGINFKINKCSGYFSQFHNFTPTLSTRCQSLNDLPEAKNLDDGCLEYLPKIRSCQMPTSLPTNLGSSCQQFIQQHANYQGCVADHKNDENFDKGEWRIFLNRTAEFWAKRNETIKLVDSMGQIIAEAAY